MNFPTPQIFQAKRLLQLPASRVCFAMAPCDRCGSGGRGKDTQSRLVQQSGLPPARKRAAASPATRGAGCPSQRRRRPAWPTAGTRRTSGNRGRQSSPARGAASRASRGRPRRATLQDERAEAGGGVRGTLGEGGRPEAACGASRRGGQKWCRRSGPVAWTAEQRLGPPYLGESSAATAEMQANYLAFVRSWARFGLSRTCEACGTLTPARHCRPSRPAGRLWCKTCRESKTKFSLPALRVVPDALQALTPLEQHLLAMARISQVLLDKLPSAGPSAQWGRMYAVLMEEPCLCEVLSGAVLDEGTVRVAGVDGLTESSARLEFL